MGTAKVRGSYRSEPFLPGGILIKVRTRRRRWSDMLGNSAVAAKIFSGPASMTKKL